MSQVLCMTLAQLQRDNFQLVVDSGDIVRVTRHGDCRVILAAYAQKRAHPGPRSPSKPPGRNC